MNLTLAPFRLRSVALAAILAAASACGWNEDRTTHPAATEPITSAAGDTLYFTARLGTASYAGERGQASQVTAGGRMTITAYQGLSTNSPVSIQMHVTNPAVGTFDLGEPFGTGVINDGWLYIGFTEDTHWYTRKSGDGSLTITSLTPTRIEGTFRFNATGASATTTPQLQSITEGKFRIPVCPVGTTVC